MRTIVRVKKKQNMSYTQHEQLPAYFDVLTKNEKVDNIDITSFSDESNSEDDESDNGEGSERDLSLDLEEEENEVSYNSNDSSEVERVSEDRQSKCSPKFFERYSCDIFNSIVTIGEKKDDDENPINCYYQDRCWEEKSDNSTEESADLRDRNNMALTDTERKVWEDWDRKDGYEKGEYAIVPFNKEINVLEENERKVKHSAKRALAHEKLLKHAYCALSATKEFTDLPKIEYNRFLVLNEDEKKENTENKSPLNLTSKQSPYIETFYSKLKAEGLKVLKLSRGNKWQLRFLTLSKEVECFRKDFSKERIFCPLGILWVKKFQKKRDYGINCIDKQGRGGILLLELANIYQLSTKESLANRLPKKQEHGEFKHSVALALRYSELVKPSRTVIIRCQNEEDANFLILGTTMLKQLLIFNSIKMDQDTFEDDDTIREDNNNPELINPAIDESDYFPKERQS